MSKVFNMVGGGGGPYASIFVTGLSETNTVTAVKDGKTVKGVWKKAIYEETESPDMTSNTAPSGVASASSAYSGNPAYLSFDSSNTSFWQPVPGATAEQTWIQYEFVEEIIPDSVFIGGCCSQSSTAQLGGSSKNAVVKFQGSLDGSSWFDISENFTVNFPSTATGFVDHGTEQLNSTATRYVRMQYVSTELPNNGVNIDGVGSVCPATIKIYGQKVVEAQGFVIEPIRELGTWTVTATDGTKTATQDVLVDVITEYQIEMSLSA